MELRVPSCLTSMPAAADLLNSFGNFNRVVEAADRARKVAKLRAPPFPRKVTYTHRHTEAPSLKVRNPESQQTEEQILRACEITKCSPWLALAMP